MRRLIRLVPNLWFAFSGTEPLRNEPPGESTEYEMQQLRNAGVICLDILPRQIARSFTQCGAAARGRSKGLRS